MAREVWVLVLVYLVPGCFLETLSTMITTIPIAAQGFWGGGYSKAHASQGPSSRRGVPTASTTSRPPGSKTLMRQAETGELE
ncbi:MAG: hypothetical protein ACE5JS_16360, partial [Nitrospinota bacterium]